MKLSKTMAHFGVKSRDCKESVAKHETLAGCQRELREALSDWVGLRLRLGLEIPEIARINLNRIGAVTHA